MSTIAERLDSLTRRRDGKRDRGALANLRRGFSETTRHYAWPVLASLGLSVDDKDAVLVAALFAEHPCHTPRKENIGATWRQVYHARKPHGGDDKDAYQMRFRRLISCDWDQLPDQLQAVIRLAASTKGIEVNYDLLYDDLRAWNEWTKLRWAKQFHAVQAEDDSEDGQ